MDIHFKSSLWLSKCPSGSFVQVPSFRFLRSGSFVLVPSFRFLRSGSFLQVPLFRFFPLGSFLQVPSFTSFRFLPSGYPHSGPFLQVPQYCFKRFSKVIDSKTSLVWDAVTFNKVARHNGSSSLCQLPIQESSNEQHDADADIICSPQNNK